MAAAVTQDANDVGQLHPMLEKAGANLRAAGVTDPVREATADAGYWSEENARPERKGAGPVCGNDERPPAAAGAGRVRGASGADAQGPQPTGTNGAEAADEPWPGGLRQACGAGVSANQGSPGLRPLPAAGGLPACHSEWQVICLTHNLLKLWVKEHLVGGGQRALPSFLLKRQKEEIDVASSGGSKEPRAPLRP